MQFWGRRVLTWKSLSTASFHGKPTLDPSEASPSSTRWFIKVVCSLFLRRSQSLSVLESDYFRDNLEPFVAFGVIHHVSNVLNFPILGFDFFRHSRLDLNTVHLRSSFDLLLRSLCRAKLHSHAGLVFGCMESDGISPNNALSDFLISSFVDSGNLRVAERILVAKGELCNRREETVSPSLCNKFLSLLISRNLVSEAVMFFKARILRSKSFRPDICSFNIVMRGLCLTGKAHEACEFLDIMRKLNCTPDIVTYNTLINGFCRTGNVDRAQELLREILSHCHFSPNVVTYTSLISGYCKAGKRMEEAINLFNELGNSGIKPNLFTYNVIIDGFGKRGKLTLALDTYKNMVKSGFNPDIVTFTSLIDAHSRLGEIHECMKLWDEMNVKKVSPNAFTFSILINALCKVNRLVEARDLLGRLMLCKDIVPRPFIYNPVIDGFCKSGNVDEANAIVKEMEGKGCVHDNMTFTILVLGHCMKGRMFEAIAIYNKMLLRGYGPDDVMVKCLVSCLRKAGMAHEACEIEQNVSQALGTKMDIHVVD